MADETTYFVYVTAHGPLTIQATGKGISRVAFGKASLPGVQAPSSLTNSAANQLQEYLAGKRKAFDLPLDVRGSEFQHRVWDAVSTIPYGSVVTAADIAAMLGRPQAFRAVGAAVKKNVLAPFIPSHRVVSGAADAAIAVVFQGFLNIEANSL